jgi:predicted phage-related endonuclease
MKEDMQSLKGKIGQQENQIKAMLQEAEAGKTDRFRVTWKNVHKEPYTVKEQNYRQLRIKEIKADD